MRNENKDQFPDNEVEARRSRNRKMLRDFYFSAVQFFFLWVSIYMPLDFSGGLFDLTKTRLGIQLTVPRDYAVFFTLWLAIALFDPVSFYSQKFAHRITSFLNEQWCERSELQSWATQKMIFMVFCLPIMGHMIYLVYPGMSYIQSLLMPIIGFAFLFLWISAGVSRMR